MNDWIPISNPPAFPGFYLVVQRNRDSGFRWVRFWDGKQWEDVKEAKYGPVTHWRELPDFPA